MSSPDVVIVTYDSGEVIQGTLESLKEHLPDAKVIVVDNGSQDDTVEIIDAHASVLLLRGHGNVGFGAGVNRGIAAARSDVVLVLNPDARVVAADDSRLDSLGRLQPLGVVSCESADPASIHPPIMKAWGWTHELLFTLWAWFLKPRSFNPPRPAVPHGERGWVGGEAFLVRRDEWELVGGFDETIFLYYEDRDLSRRYAARGLPLRSTQAIQIIHDRPVTRSTHPELIQSWALRGFLQAAVNADGRRAGRRLAVRLLIGLRLLESLFAAISPVMPFSLRFRRKRDSARVLRELLLSDPAGLHQRGYYAEADRALLHAATRLRISGCAYAQAGETSPDA